MFAHQMVFQVISSRVCGATEVTSVAGTQRRKWTRWDRSLVDFCLHCMKLKKIYVLIQHNYFGFWMRKKMPFCNIFIEEAKCNSTFQHSMGFIQFTGIDFGRRNKRTVTIAAVSQRLKT